MMVKDAAISVRVSPDVKLEIERVAKADGRTLSQYVERLIVGHLASLDPKKPPRK